MSDFLSHLIAKNLDGTETLRPRPPGIFEPTKGGGGSLSGEPLHSALAGAFDEPEATGLQDPKTAAGAPVTDDRSGSADQPLGQFTPARMDHVAWVKRSETRDPKTRVDSIQAAPASIGANVRHVYVESALERITRPFDPTRDSPALGEQRLTRLPEPISRGSEEQLSPKNAPQIPLRPRTSPAAERKDDEAVTPQILGEPVRQLAPKSATKFIVVEEARPILTRQLNRSLSEQGSEATAARNDDGRLTITDLMPLASVQSDLPPVQSARVSTPAVARPQVTRYVEPFMQVPDAYTRGTPETVPTIQVTIGRIEVRATPAPTQHAKQPRSAPSVMTLDEYLRNRGKGEGR